MKILAGPRLPGPFGSIKLPDLETPPIKLPSKPDAHARKAIGHAIGQDGATVVGLIPWVGEDIQAVLEDLHQAEIQQTLTTEEYRTFLQYNKLFPSTVAMGRTLLFKEVKTTKELPKGIKGLMPMSPKDGPPLPRSLGIKWLGGKK